MGQFCNNRQYTLYQYTFYYVHDSTFVTSNNSKFNNKFREEKKLTL